MEALVRSLNAYKFAGLHAKQFAVSQNHRHRAVLVCNSIVDSRLGYEIVAYREVAANLAWQVNLEGPSHFFAHIALFRVLTRSGHLTLFLQLRLRTP